MIDINLMMIYNFQTHSGVCKTLSWAHAINRTVWSSETFTMPIAAIGNFCHRHWAETKNALSTQFYAVDRQQGGKTFFQRTTFKDALRHLLFFAVV